MEETGRDNNAPDAVAGGEAGTKRRRSIMKKDDRSRAAGATSLAHHVFKSDDCKRFLGSDLPGDRAFISKDALYPKDTSSDYVLDWKNGDDHQGGYVLQRGGEEQVAFSSRFARRVDKDAHHLPNRAKPVNVPAKVQHDEPEKRKVSPCVLEESEAPKKERRLVATSATGNTIKKDDKIVLQNGVDDSILSPTCSSQPSTTTATDKRRKVLTMYSSPQKRGQLSPPTKPPAIKPPPPKSPPSPPQVSKSSNKEEPQGTLPPRDSANRRWSLE
jgi:hypothetical protein